MKKIKLRIEFTHNKRTPYWKWLMAILKRNPTFKSWEENGVIFYYFEVELENMLEYQKAIELVLPWKTTRVWINDQPTDWREVSTIMYELKYKIQRKKIIQEAEKIIEEYFKKNKSDKNNGLSTENQ